MSNRTKILRTLAVLGVLACIAAGGVFSAFSSQTDNPGNVVTAGTVALADNDAGSALYSIANAKPGDSQVSCVKVTYSGSLDASVRLYTPSTIGALGPSVSLKIEPGTQAAPRRSRWRRWPSPSLAIRQCSTVLTVTVTDNALNAATLGGTATVDNTPPSEADVQTTNAGTNGRAER
jgi:predicted ribosomally synthesized peptide with SipW-like signal peptide